MKVYIVCPHIMTGGPKSLHQLGDKLVDRGFQVFIFYGRNGIPSGETKLLFEDCKADVTNRIDDNESNVLIMPESDTSWYFKFSKINKVIWWLSLDYYLYSNPLNRAIKITKLKNQNSIRIPFRYIKYNFFENKAKYIRKNKEFQEAYHLYNCEYVRLFLKRKAVYANKMSYLCGPIVLQKNNFLNREKIIQNKEDVIAYNPAKVNNKMMNLIKEYMRVHFKQYKFIPIKNMNHNEVLKTLQSAKIYLDLGYFPGPERMPREAVSNYCNIITSNIGSASNSVDVPIPNKFKFSLKKENIPDICNLIVKMSDNFSDYLEYFDSYREKVRKQIQYFDEEIDTFTDAIKNCY